VPCSFSGKTGAVIDSGDTAWASKDNPTIDFGEDHSVRFPFSVKLRAMDHGNNAAIGDAMGDAEFTVSAAGKGVVDNIRWSTQGAVTVVFESTDAEPQEGFTCEASEIEAVDNALT
jgi:hypothetical protein